MHHHSLDTMAREAARTMKHIGYSYKKGEIDAKDFAYVQVDKVISRENKNGKTNIWLADSGASTHMGNSDEGMFDVKVIKSPVKIGNGKTVMALKWGKKRITIIQKDGSMIHSVLEDYKYVPDMCVNLFSITKALQKGWNIGNKGLELFLKKGIRKSCSIRK